ncbi:MAG: hypothetical protein ACSHW2_04990 [Parasphingopyxis sp.]
MATQRSLFRLLRKDRFTILAAMLLFAQAIVPSGFMPVFAKDGPTIMLCSGQGLGLQAAALPADASAAMLALADALDDDETPAETDTAPCDYAAAPNPISVPPAFSGAAVPVIRIDGIFPPAGLVAIGAGLAAPPPPQTGPPATF